MAVARVNLAAALHFVDFGAEFSRKRAAQSWLGRGHEFDHLVSRFARFGR
jgi:hypothetical protein